MGRVWELPLYGPNLQTPARLSPTALPMLVPQETACRAERPWIQATCIFIDDSSQIQTTCLEFNYSLQNVETYRLLQLAFFAKNVQQLQPHPLIGT